MNNKQGVSVRQRLSGKIDYRASLTYKGKHIALGSYDSKIAAHNAYEYGKKILKSKSVRLKNIPEAPPLYYEKCVSLINVRDNGLYIANPIYLKKKFFLYCLSPSVHYRFDIEDLFYFSSHKIMKRGGHLFVSDYGSQLNVLSRFGIKPHSVQGRDYDFYNGDPTDLRYENIKIINRYNGVHQVEERGFIRFKSVINMHSNYIVGIYDTEKEAAVAYNKAAKTLIENGVIKKFKLNFIENISESEYMEIYKNIYISPKITHFVPKNISNNKK